MERNVKAEDLHQTYDVDDPVTMDADGCRGCSHCCQHAGVSIVLDPRDMYELERGTGRTFTELLETDQALEVHIQEGLMLPNLKMTDKRGCCFLKDDRCTVHPYRPGYCRLFPLARLYQDHGFRYILQSGECFRTLTKSRTIREWIGIKEYEEYAAFVLSWHDFRKKITEGLSKITLPQQKMFDRYLLRRFYQEPYDLDRSFYPQYKERLTLTELAWERIPGKN